MPPRRICVVNEEDRTVGRVGWLPRARRAVLIVLGLSWAASWAVLAAKPSLYERLGGQAGVGAVVSDLIDRVSSDPHTRRSFEGLNLAHAKQELAEFLCSITGGGCTYRGGSIAATHSGLDITAAEFDVTTQHLSEALDARVGPADRDALLQLLAPMKGDIVTR